MADQMADVTLAELARSLGRIEARLNTLVGSEKYAAEQGAQDRRLDDLEERDKYRARFMAGIVVTVIASPLVTLLIQSRAR